MWQPAIPLDPTHITPTNAASSTHHRQNAHPTETATSPSVWQPAIPLDPTHARASNRRLRTILAEIQRDVGRAVTAAAATATTTAAVFAAAIRKQAAVAAVAAALASTAVN